MHHFFILELNIRIIQTYGRLCHINLITVRFSVKLFIESKQNHIVMI